MPSRPARRSSARISASTCGRSPAWSSESRRAALDVEVRLGALLEPGERVLDLADERRLGPTEPGIGEAVGDHSRAEAEPRQALVQVARRLDQPKSIGASKVKTRFVTAPLEAIATTITTRG